MHILSIATTYPRWANDSEPGYVHALNRELCRRGHKVTVVVPHAAGARRRERLDGVEVIRFSYFFPFSWQRLSYNGGILPNLKQTTVARFNLPFFLICQLCAVLVQLRKKRIDLLHCHWLVPMGFFLALLRDIVRVPVVVTAHGSDIFTDQRLFRYMDRVVLRRCKVCTANSERSRTRMLTLCPGASVYTIPMGVDTRTFTPAAREAGMRRRMGDGKPQLLFVGRFETRKGLRYCIEAMPDIVRLLPDAKLALVGFGPLYTQMHSWIRHYRMERHVDIVGKVAHSKMAACMASADIFVLPSFSEGLGVVLLEAMACACPVVSTPAGKMTGLVRHEETGLVCNLNNPGDLAAACIRMHGEERLRERCRENALAMVRRDYSWESVGARFESLFKKSSV